MFAVFESGGKQHRVTDGEILRLEKIEAEVGDLVVFDRVMLIAREGEIAVGAPFVTGSQVQAEVVQHGRADKVQIIKFRRRKNRLKRQGHRQWFTEVRIRSITA
jgi:large subunit ribosomal protein L21